MEPLPDSVDSFLRNIHAGVYSDDRERWQRDYDAMIVHSSPFDAERIISVVQAKGPKFKTETPKQAKSQAQEVFEKTVLEMTPDEFKEMIEADLYREARTPELLPQPVALTGGE